MKSVILVRVSSKEQEETGYSLPAQEKLLREYATANDCDVIKVYRLTESASGHKQRKVFNEMVTYAKKNHIKNLVVEKTDRLTRNIKDAVAVNDWLESDDEVRVHFVKENFILHKNSKSNEKFIWNIKVSVAQYYLDNLSEEVKKGQKEKIAQGWLPTKPPIGYKTVGDKGHKIHVVDDEKAPIVKKMFELHSGGNYSIRRITSKMVRLGLRNRNGNKLGKSNIHRLLTDPFYCGIITWNNSLYEGKHQPLVSKEIFDVCQSILNGNNTPKYSKHFYLFKGMMRCGHCGGQITWEQKKGIMYGHCNHYHNCTEKAWSHETALEDQLVEAIGGLEVKYPRFIGWIRKALKESHEGEINYRNQAVNELNTRLQQIATRLDKLYDDKLDGQIDMDFYDKKFKEYTLERTEVVSQLEKYNNADRQYFELGVDIYDLAQRAKEIYKKATKEEKRELMRLIFEKLTLEGRDNLNAKYSKPFQILFDAISRTNRSVLSKSTKSQKTKLEPDTLPDISNKYDDSTPQCPTMLARLDSNQEPFR